MLLKCRPIVCGIVFRKDRFRLWYDSYVGTVGSVSNVLQYYTTIVSNSTVTVHLIDPVVPSDIPYNNERREYMY